MNFEMQPGGENEESKGQEREKVIAEVKEYFEKYVTDADNADEDQLGGQNVEDIYTDLTKIRNILRDMEGNDFSGAYEYLDEEVKRMEGIHQKMREEGGMSVGDIEEGLPYLEKVKNLRDNLIFQE